jgi:SAM-dependent methyltransferase
MDLREIPPGSARRHPWEVTRARFFCSTLLEDGFGGAARTVLEAGAGDGFVSTELAARLPAGSEVVCFDRNYSDDDLARFAAVAAPGVRYTRANPARRFDAVLLLDVLEHVLDDAAFLSAVVSDNLVPGAGGRVLISVPAWPALYTEHDRALHHHRRYTPAACRALIGSAGLEVIRGGGLFHGLLPIRALGAMREAALRRLGRAPGPPKLLGEWKAGGLVSAVVEGALAADTAISRQLARAGISLPGLSYWALCKTR